MAMVDASLGGKNGINFQGVKNIVGTFEAPNELIICPTFLSSLPDEALLSGMAEMLKHGLIKDQALWDALIALDEISAETLTPFIQRNIQIKLQIVEDDPFENGQRKLLNFGHTIGHALESYSLKQNIQNTHGQCVAWGMIFACLISKSDELLNQDEAEDIIENLLDLYPLPSVLPQWNELEKYLIQDKKNQSGKLQFTLIKAIGKGIIQQSKSLSEVEPLWSTFTALK
jgi:3-dehydroquinate synthase